ncbi:MAG: hypothetical protein K2X80_07920 [Pseudomonadaceae bacterium]|nr:hypothetical protein [Pseudomonadaceae bacterium]
MHIKGIVCGYHAQMPRFAIRTDCGYSVVDVEVGQRRMHDQVAGELDGHGQTTLQNETTGEDVEVCVEAIQATREGAASLLRSR